MHQKLLKGTIDLAIADFPENLPGISLTGFYREENVLVIEKALFAKCFISSAEECKRHLLARDYSALKECPFVLGCIQFWYQAQSYQWSVIEEFILCAKAVVC